MYDILSCGTLSLWKNTILRLKSVVLHVFLFHKCRLVHDCTFMRIVYFWKIFIINIWLTAFHVGTIPKCFGKNHYFEKLSDFFLSIPRGCKRLIFLWKYIGNNFKTVFHFYDFFGWPKCPSADVQKLKCFSNIFAEVPFVGFESWYLSTSRQYSKRSMSSKVDNQPNPMRIKITELILCYSLGTAKCEENISVVVSEARHLKY